MAVAGLVIARQRPGTAKGTMFLLFEDEWGTINLIVPPAIYERHRPLARAEPLLLAHGRLERTAGERIADGEEVPPVVNVIVHELAALERFLAPAAGEEIPVQAHVHHLPGVAAGASTITTVQARTWGSAPKRRTAPRSVRVCARWRRPCRASRRGAGGRAAAAGR